MMQIILSVGADILTVLLSATLLVLPIEDGAYWPLAFVALVPLLLRMWGRSYLSVFFLGFSAFYLYLFYVLEWIDVYGLQWRIFLVFMNSVSYGAVFVIFFWLSRKWCLHFYALVLPSLLVLMEFKQTLGFLGFPWPLLCHSQYANLPLIQIASVGGCWAVVFLLANVNEALARLMVGHFKPRVLPIAVVPVILIGLCGLYGAISLAHTPSNSDVLAMVVQGSRATNEAWTPEFNLSALDEYTNLTRGEFLRIGEAGGSLNDLKRLVVWPETSIPDAVIQPGTTGQIEDLASSNNATFVVGCITLAPADGIPLDLKNGLQFPDNPNEYNSLVVFEPDRTVVPIYSKVHLVPLGEVIPLKEYVTKFFPSYPWGSSDISQGSGFHVISTPAGKIGAVVCYESFFPQLARETVLNGAEILVLGSNTSWFQRTKATYQHANFDVFRAIENGIWFCRAATTGVSSVIDPQGHVLFETRMFEPEAVSVPVGLRKGTTLYTRFGDWLPALCGIFIVALLLGAFIVRQKGESSEGG